MKDSIANVWLLGIVMLFILMFSAYIAVTVDYSQTFKLKNTVLTIIEKDKGMSGLIFDLRLIKIPNTNYE